MKKQISYIGLIISALFCSFSASAQKIHFSDSSNHWLTYFAMSQGASHLIEVYYKYDYKDTVVEFSGHNYNWLYDGRDGNYLIREEGNKVYLKPLKQYINSYLFTDSSHEFLYFDYDLAVGDTLRMPMVNSYSTNSVSEHVVRAIDSILINNVWHKVFDMEVVSGFSGTYEFTEGMGTKQGPIIVPYEPAYQADLICFKNNGTIPLAAYNKCNYNPTPIHEVRNDAPSGNMRLYPNPANQRVNVAYLGTDNPDLKLSITDLFGRVVLKSSFSKEMQIDVHSFPAGIYVVQIRKGDEIFSDKIVVTK